MGKKRQYTDAEKAETLAILTANGGNVSATSKQTGIPRATITNWRDGDGVNGDVSEIRQEKEETLIDRFSREIWDILKLMDGKRKEATYRELATAFGIFVDKRELLLGNATSRVDHEGGINLTNMTDEELARRAGLDGYSDPFED